MGLYNLSTPHRFGFVVDVRGTGSGPELPVRGVRSETVWLHAPGHGLKRPVRLLHPRHRVYLVPRPGDIVLVGASEIESEDGSPVSLRSAVELMAAAHSVLPALAEARNWLVMMMPTHGRDFQHGMPPESCRSQFWIDLLVVMLKQAATLGKLTSAEHPAQSFVACASMLQKRVQITTFDVEPEQPAHSVSTEANQRCYVNDDPARFELKQALAAGDAFLAVSLRDWSDILPTDANSPAR